MIRLSNISRVYLQNGQEHWAVKDVNINIGAGEVVGLLGVNGAGKSTLMKIIAGVLTPTSGEAFLADILLGSSLCATTKAAQQQLGFLPETTPTYPDMSVVDYLFFVCAMRGVAKSEQAAAVREVCEWTDLFTHINNPISTLSRGFTQRVGVAQALLNRPKVVVLDEPTNGLDPAQTTAMRRLISKMAKGELYAQQGAPKPVTVLMSTHIMQEVSAVCDRVILLRQGKVVVDEKINEVQNNGKFCLRIIANIDEKLLHKKACACQNINLESIRIEKIPMEAHTRELPSTACGFWLHGQLLNRDKVALWEFQSAINHALHNDDIMVFEIMSDNATNSRLASLFAGDTAGE